MDSNPLAVDDWIARHGARALAFLQSLLRDRDDARDAWQETFAALWRSAHRVRSDVDAWPYIRRTALRKAFDRMAARRAAPGTLDVEPAAPSPRVLDVDLDLARLADDERAAIELFFWQGCSIKEIAMRLELAENTVKSRLFRARAKLRKDLLDRGFLP